MIKSRRSRAALGLLLSIPLVYPSILPAEENEITDLNAEPDRPAVLIEAREMFAAPMEVTGEEWEALAKRLEASLPEIASHQQQLREDLRKARQTGRSDSAVMPLIEQRQEIERQIEAAIEALPAVTNLQQAIQQSGAELNEAMKLRVRAIQLAEAPVASASKPARNDTDSGKSE